MKTISTDHICYTSHGYEVDYQPSPYVSTLDWFNISKCARDRMTEYCDDIHRWRGERRSFYTSITKMEVDTKVLMD